MTPDERLETYAKEIEPLLPLAKRAYGSRDTQSPQHDASRKYTALLVEFYDEGKGSLLKMSKRLGVAYPGVRRRVTTAKIPPNNLFMRRKFSDKEYAMAVADILAGKRKGTHAYHFTLKVYHDRGMSMSRIAKELGLSSAQPLYYGIDRIRLEES